MRRLITAAIVIILVMFMIIVALLIGKCSPQTDAEPTAVPTLDVPTSMAITQAPTPTPEPTEAPTPEPTGLPLAVTEGTLDEVFARLEELKKLPEEETIILLDVGHGGLDCGSIGMDTEVYEADLNLYVSRELAKKLAEKGYYVFMTRMGDYALAETKNGDMRKRTEIMKLGIFDLSVSIHMNSFQTDRSVKGARIYCYKTGTPSEKYAQIVGASIAEATGTAFQRVYTDNLMVVREPVAPSILVECGFISNPEEERLLQTQQYQELLGGAIADGIETFLNGEQ